MGDWVDFKDKVRRYFWPDAKEWRGMLIAIVAVAFIISFNDWGSGANVSVSEGMMNWLLSGLIVAIVFLVHDFAQRFWALAIDFRKEYKMWGIGLVLGVVAAFLFRGEVWLIVPAGFIVHHMVSHRLGWFRYGINYFAIGMIALAGPLALVVLLMILNLLSLQFAGPFLDKMMLVTAVYAITSMVPIPPLDGSKVYFASRMLYAFMMPVIVIATILLLIDMNVILAIVISLILALVMWVAYYLLYEQNAWVGPG